MRSCRENKSVDYNGNPIPWMNFPVVRLLEERLSSDLKLFEFGSGYSTLFFANRVRTVTTIENDERWYDFIKSQAPKNVELILMEEDINGNYCRTIDSTGDQYDVVIVDGSDRTNCIKRSVSALSPKGVIILDDSQREIYIEGIEYLKRKGFKLLTFEGLKSNDSSIERTTIFYRIRNCLNI